jgi:hypothetical protein
MTKMAVHPQAMEIFQKLCSWSRNRAPDGTSYLNKLALEVAIYFVCQLEDDDFEYDRVLKEFDSIGTLAEYYMDFSGQEDETVRVNRLHEAVHMLKDVNFLVIEREESTSELRENYGYGNKMIWEFAINLAEFDWCE